MVPTDEGEPSPYLIPLSADGHEVMSVDMAGPAQGWAAYFSGPVTDAGAAVLVRMALEAPPAVPAGKERRSAETALVVKEIRVAAGPRTAGFTSSLLREIPILRIEAAINQTAHRRVLTGRMPNSVQMDDLPGGQRFRARPSGAVEIDELDLTVVDPGGYRKPSAFYRQVADLFLHQAAISKRPAHDIAQANGVPLATVHRWIREAKARRILLLPAHRGGGEPKD